MKRSVRTGAAALAAVAGLLAGPVGATEDGWTGWQRLPGIVDVDRRSDGTVLAMAAGRLYSISRDGQISPFASGPAGFAAASADAESYFVITPNRAVEGTGCSFGSDETFVLELGAPPGVVRIDPSGQAARFATLNGVETLGGIAFDATGRFGYRLLVTGSHGGLTTVFAIDCNGSVTIITATAPPVEGGLAVAPSTFGAFGGDLIAPDENSGQVWAIDPTGQARLVAVPDLPTGGDTGVESLGFVPAGFSGASSLASAYLADRGTPNNPFPGSDNLLRLSGGTLFSAGVQDGDLLVATEGRGTTVAIHCDTFCTVIPVASGTPGGHIEGKLLVVVPVP